MKEHLNTFKENKYYTNVFMLGLRYFGKIYDIISVRFSHNKTTQRPLIMKHSNAKPEIRDFFTSQKYTLYLSAITLLCGGLILLSHFLNPEQGADSMLYIELIDKWHQGGFDKIIREWPDYWLPPLYFYLAHLFMYSGLSAEAAGVCVSMLCGMAVPLITFGIAKELTQNKNIALSAALLIAVNPILIELACGLQRDMPYFCFCALAFYFFIAGVRKEKWYFYLLSGIFCGVAFFIRYETIEFILLACLYTFLAVIFKRNKWYSLCKDLSLLFAGIVISIVLLMMTMDTSDGKMVKMYCKYYSDKIELLKSLYQKNAPQSADKSIVKGGKNG